MAQDRSRIHAFISNCSSPEELRNLIANARAQGAPDVEAAAFRRLISILPEADPGSVEHDFWQTVHAFEHVLTEERGRATRLSRTRQKVARVGVVKTLTDWATSKTPTEGFKMLIDRGMHDLLGESIVLRHNDVFDAVIVEAARRRLIEAGVIPDDPVA